MRLRQALLVWLASHEWDSMVREADRVAPCETGGILMGYAADERQVVVTRVIGPGPRGIHTRRRFVPDYDYQERAVAKHYRSTARRETYLGDWHTHPNARSAHLSLTDRRTLARIARDPDARVPCALMVMLYGENGEWDVAAWVTIGVVRLLSLARASRAACRQY